jgi:hypothetical protein
VNGVLGGSTSLLFALLVCAVFAVGGSHLLGFLYADQLMSLRPRDWGDAEADLVWVMAIILRLLAAALVILTMFVSSLVVAANFLLLRTIRVLLYGLVSTYVAGPGTPAWIEEKPNVVAIPIPAKTTTLSFGMRPEERDILVENGRRATLERLDQMDTLKIL